MNYSSSTITKPVFQVDVVALLAEAHRHLEALVNLSNTSGLDEKNLDRLIDFASARVKRFEDLAAKQAMMVHTPPWEDDILEKP